MIPYYTEDACQRDVMFRLTRRGLGRDLPALRRQAHADVHSVLIGEELHLVPELGEGLPRLEAEEVLHGRHQGDGERVGALVDLGVNVLLLSCVK